VGGDGPSASAPPAGERDGKGRFVKGNRGGPGNPFARRVAALRKAFLDVADEAKLRALAQKLYDLALSGDLPAAKLYLSYTPGEPTPAPDPDRLDLEEWKLAAAAPSRLEVFKQAFDGFDPGVAAHFASQEKNPDEASERLFDPKEMIEHFLPAILAGRYRMSRVGEDGFDVTSPLDDRASGKRR